MPSDPIDTMTTELYRVCGEARQAIERERLKNSRAEAVRQRSKRALNEVAALLTTLRLQPLSGPVAPRPPSTGFAAVDAAEQAADEADRALRELSGHLPEARRVRHKWYQFW